MTSSSPAGARRLDVALPGDLAQALDAYARRWRLARSAVIAIACREFLDGRARCQYQAPIRLRYRMRRGPLAQVERMASEDALGALRQKGGRPL